MSCCRAVLYNGAKAAAWCLLIDADTSHIVSFSFALNRCFQFQLATLHQGEAVQVEPMKPVFNQPENARLKL